MQADLDLKIALRILLNMLWIDISYQDFDQTVQMYLKADLSIVVCKCQV